MGFEHQPGHDFIRAAEVADPNRFSLEILDRLVFRLSNKGMGRAVQETRHRPDGHTAQRPAYDGTEEQRIADIPGYQSGEAVGCIHTDDFNVQSFIFEKTLFQGRSRRQKRYVEIRHRDADFFGGVDGPSRYAEQT